MLGNVRRPRAVAHRPRELHKPGNVSGNFFKLGFGFDLVRQCAWVVSRELRGPLPHLRSRSLGVLLDWFGGFHGGGLGLGLAQAVLLGSEPAAEAEEPERGQHRDAGHNEPWPLLEQRAEQADDV